MHPSQTEHQERDAVPSAGVLPIVPNAAPRSVPELLRALATDAGSLLRQEVELAKGEVLESLTRFGRNAGLIAGGAFLLGVGLVVLFVFVILLLGRLLGGEYWLSTLIVGGVLAVGGIGLMVSGRRGLARTELAPRRTIQTLQENRAWAEAETRRLHDDLTT